MTVEDKLINWSIPEPNTGCWLWLRATNRKGYGVVYIDGKHTLAHRASYQEFCGMTPDGFVIDHKCRVHSCINPDHLRAVTSAENTLAHGSESPAAINKNKDFCIKGHSLLDPENVKLSRGYRECRKCKRLYKIKYRNAARQQGLPHDRHH